MDPVGITNASTTKARKMKARMNATRIDSTVSLALPSSALDARRAAAAAAAGGGGRPGVDCAEAVEALLSDRRTGSAAEERPQALAHRPQVFRRQRAVVAG